MRIKINGDRHFADDIGNNELTSGLRTQDELIENESHEVMKVTKTFEKINETWNGVCLE